MSKQLATILGCALTLIAATAVAHHSAAQFDFQNRVTLHGVVKKIRVENPHLQMILHVADSKGARDIEYEGHSLNNFYRSGWRTDSVKAGDAIDITIAPRKDGADGGYIVAFKTAKGQEIGSNAPAESR